jgi:uncharacterized membrane protein
MRSLKMSSLFIASPLCYGISQWVRSGNTKGDSDNLYGGDRPKNEEVPSTLSIVFGLAVAVAVLCFFVIVPMGRAFNCGPRVAAFGLTGTSWGLLLLLTFIFAQPLAVFIGVVYLLAGRCKGALVTVPSQAFPNFAASPNVKYVPTALPSGVGGTALL